jgi:hypothetical protein
MNFCAQAAAGLAHRFFVLLFFSRAVWMNERERCGRLPSDTPGLDHHWRRLRVLLRCLYHANGDSPHKPDANVRSRPADLATANLFWQSRVPLRQIIDYQQPSHRNH